MSRKLLSSIQSKGLICLKRHSNLFHWFIIYHRLTALRQRKLVKLTILTEIFIIPLLFVACELLSEGVAAIFGPGTMETSGIVSSIADTVEVPHIIAHWDRESFGRRQTNSKMTLNVFPDAETLSRAYAELLVDYTWKSYTIIYEDDDGLMRLKDILQVHDPESAPITVRWVVSVCSTR